MARNVKFTICVALIVCMALLSAPMAQAAMPCNQITSNLIPCASYLQHGGMVPPNCCNGIRTVVNSARTTADRQNACNCLKSAAGNFHGLNPANAESLPGKCGVNIPYKISTSTNCASIK